MASALNSGGSSAEWRAIRHVWSERLRVAGSWPCWRCGRLIIFGEPWDLGHIVDRALGGDDSELGPEHRSCSRRAGAELGLRLRARRQITSAPRGVLFGEDDE